MIQRRPLWALAFVLPAVAIYLILIIYPLIQGGWLSLTDSQIGNAGNFVGVSNFAHAAADSTVRKAIVTTISYAAVVVIVQNLIGLALARALYNRPRIRRAVSVLILLPTLMSAVMAGFVWSSLYSPDGAINVLLRTVGFGGVTRVWLGDPSTALWAIALVNVWMFCGYSAAIFLAGYMNMPAEITEAATLDGASGFRRFWSVEWPLLAPALTVNVTLALIGSLKVFELPLVLTNGGPAGSTTTLSILIYQKIFGGQGTFAYGATIALILLAIVVIFAMGAQTVLRRRERRI